MHGTCPTAEKAIVALTPPPSQFLALEGLLDGGLKFRPMTLPDRYIEAGTQVGGCVGGMLQRAVGAWHSMLRVCLRQLRGLFPPPGPVHSPALVSTGWLARGCAQAQRSSAPAMPCYAVLPS